MTGASNLQNLRIIPLIIAICFFNSPAYAKYGGGTGEPNDPYLIYTAEQLNTIGLNQEDADKHFKLMADIDLSAYQGDSFNRIGFYDPIELAPDWHSPFTGVFDGNYHTISNFTYVIDVNEPLEKNGKWGDEKIGLFAVVSGEHAQIKNLILIDPNIYPAASCSERVRVVGAIAGRLSDGSITNCYVEGGRISADSIVGGLVGSNLEGTISDCYTTCVVTWAKGRPLRPIDEPSGNTGYFFGGLVGYSRGWIYNCHTAGVVQAAQSCGGLVGYNDCDIIYSELDIGIISDSSATGDVSGNKNIGGLVGENSGRIHDCRALGNVSGSNKVGGLVGNMIMDEGSISDSYATGDVSSNEEVGGLVGYSNGSIQDSYATGEVSGTVYVGGLVGWSGSGTINRSYASGAVSGSENVGALVGRNGGGTIHYSYAIGSVSGDIYVGGLVGTNFNMIRYCYATNAVSGIEKVGGLVGDNWSSGATIITCFWNIETSGLTDMCGIQSSGAIGCDNAYGKTTIDMQTASTFLDAGWDFMDETENGTEDIWKITEGMSYPQLWWEKYGGGTGEPNDPYLIFTAKQLNTIGLNKEDADKHFKLMADIDLSAYQGDSFNRIGSYDPPPTVPQYWCLPFTGVFDGNYHTISNLTYVIDVNEPPSWGDYGDQDVGLFGTVSSLPDGPRAQIKNLGLINPNIYPASSCSERVSYVGAIAGHLHNGSITNCYVEGGRVSADTQAGGLVGSVSLNGTISNCYTTCNVTWAKDRWLRPIEEPWGNTGYSFGGLAGFNGGQIYNCYATGRIEADSRVGGLVGGNGHNAQFDVVICDSYATGDVSGVESVGGLVGRNSDTIRRCCAFGSVTGSDMVGGLVGINDRLGNDQYVGIVTNSYAMSRTSGNNHVGGMAGLNMGMLISCYSASEVSGTSNVGGLVGTNQYYSKDGTADNCFWDIVKSGQWTSKGGTGKTTDQMQINGTFLEAGWDFVDETENGKEDIWSILEGQDYPRLWWEVGDEASP